MKVPGLADLNRPEKGAINKPCGQFFTQILSDCFDFLFAIESDSFLYKKGFVIQFEDFLFRKEN